MVRDDAESTLTRLSLEDQNMICLFVLASGSVKDLSQAYGVSYPTMRGRLDSLIGRLRQLVEGKQPDPVSDYLAQLIDRGRIASADATKLRELHRDSLRLAAQRLQEDQSS